tara:strand:+ start:132 stop:302 length:171 start_codon:yes stop_codon:yes gene_type:complete
MEDKDKTKIEEIIEERDSFHQVIHELVERVRELTNKNESLQTQLGETEEGGDSTKS